MSLDYKGDILPLPNACTSRTMPKATSTDRVAVAMLGARMHYAVPRLLQEAGLLDRFYTDNYLGNKPWLANLLRAVPGALAPRGLRRWLGRQHSALPPSQVTSFEFMGLSYALSRHWARSTDTQEQVSEKIAGRFAAAILRHGLGEARAIWGFNTASLEIFTQAKAERRICILEQTILPRKLEPVLMREVVRDWPDWQPGLTSFNQPGLLAKREAQEWALADRIVTGSNFVLNGLVECGVPSEKISVIPYGVDPCQFLPLTKRAAHEGPLRVLFVGEVGLRKGAPYLLEALRRLGPQKVDARLAGRVAIKPSQLHLYGDVAKFLGVVPRAEMPTLYRWADVFVLPSIIEGSATVTYEALLSGLPVIATPNTGSIVRDGVDGRIVPTRNIEALVAALETYADDPQLLAAHAAETRAGRERAGLDRYGRDLVHFIEELV